MSLHVALHDPVFRTYALLTLIILAVAGIILLVLDRGFKRDVRSIWLTYRSWLVMLPVIFGCVLAGRGVVIAGVALLSMFAFKEYAKATGLYRDWWMTGAVYLAILGVAAASLMHDPFLHVPGWLGLFLALPVYAISLLLIVPILRNRTHGQLQATATSVLGFIYVGWMFGHLGFLANADHPYGYLLYIVLATELNDVAAFTCGKLFGRHPLRSNISPRKTWEGFLGAAAISLALPWAVRFSFPHFSHAQLLLTGLIVGIGGQLGDLCISVIKRDVGIKDMGAALPGHGGILDRIDSLIFAAPLFMHMIQYCHGIR